MERRTFLETMLILPTIRMMARPPAPAPMFVGITPAFNAALKFQAASVFARVRFDKADLGIGALNPPVCAAFPGGAFARAADVEMSELLADLGRPRRPWYHGPHKGPRGKTRRAPGNLPKRLRKAARRK